jgi:hypothetical protein
MVSLDLLGQICLFLVPYVNVAIISKSFRLQQIPALRDRSAATTAGHGGSDGLFGQAERTTASCPYEDEVIYALSLRFFR